MKIRFANTFDSYDIFRVLIVEAENKSDQDLADGKYYQKWAPVFEEMLQSNYLQVFVALDEDVFVKESERSKDLGTALFKEVVDFLKDNKVKYVSASVDSKNERAQGFYKSLGFEQVANDWKLKIF